MMELLIAGFTASILTLFDLDRTFYIPAKFEKKLVLYSWWWGFIVINGLLAAALLAALGNDILNNFNPFLRAVTVGIGYLAIIRAKLTTFSIQGTEVPFGFELAYEAAKSFAYKRINSIAKEARTAETIELSTKCTLEELANKAKLSVSQDQLLEPEDKNKIKQWILKVIQDNASDDMAKRQALSSYLLSNQIPFDLI